MVSLAPKVIGSAWDYVDVSEAQAVFVDPKDSGATALLQEPDSASRPLLIPVIDEDEVASVGLSLRRPLRAMNILETLKEAGQRLGDKRSGSSAPVRPTLSPAPANAVQPTIGASTEPASASLASTLHRIRQNLQKDNLYRIDTALPEPLYILTPECVFRSRMAFSEIVNLDPTGTCSVTELPRTHAEFQRLETPVQSLPQLLWSVGLASGRGQLLPWLAHAQTFKLRRWPDFVLLRHTSDFVRLSAALFRQPMTLAALSEVAGFPLAMTNDFANACDLCGYLEIVATPAGVATPQLQSSQQPQGNRRSLFAKIRHRLGI